MDEWRVVPESGSKKARGVIMPQLTSLVDVMTILLVFLLKSFSVEGNIVTPSADLELPVSTSKARPEPVATIEITRAMVMAEGEAVADVGSFAESDSMLIPELYAYMQDVSARAQTEKSAREVMIQSDRTVAFNVVKRVMYTCTRAGFLDFSVLVVMAEG